MRFYKIIESAASQSDLKIQLRGYLSPIIQEDAAPSVSALITNDLYAILRGKSHLVFANSRGRTEAIAANLSDHCERDNVPNEFFTHHGSLSKELRENLETRLQQEKLPTTAICTMTLELGIDIGSVDSIAQVTAPHSVASLRQRLGRSGRRGEAAILRMFITENEINSKTHILDRLRLETFQCIAMVNLLLKKWYEPPMADLYHLSTLLQQTLSVIGQYGGVRANQLWSLLCETGPFRLIHQVLYGKFLKALGEQHLISQTQDGQIILGYKGEKLIEHYTFYTAFNTPEEYRLEYKGHVLGTLPIDSPLAIGQLIIFAGKRWEVLQVNIEKKLIILKKSSGGRPPKFGGNTQMIHSMVRQEMLDIYLKNIMPSYLDKNAKTFFEEGVRSFQLLKLNKENIIQHGNTVHIFPWLGDQITYTIAAILRNEGLSADCFGSIIDISNCSLSSFETTVNNILRKSKPNSLDLTNAIPNTIIEKHDSLLPKELRNLNYAARFFDTDGAWNWFLSITTPKNSLALIGNMK